MKCNAWSPLYLPTAIAVILFSLALALPLRLFMLTKEFQKGIPYGYILDQYALPGPGTYTLEGIDGNGNIYPVEGEALCGEIRDLRGYFCQVDNTPGNRHIGRTRGIVVRERVPAADTLATP